MGNRPVIGVLSPFIGGIYYGGLIVGAARAAAAVGSRVIAVQTLDAGAFMAVSQGSSEFTQPVAWDRVDGFIVLADAVDATYLQRLGAAGKPIVLVGHQPPGVSAPVVLSDNRTGVRAAVTDLIRHGHRLIAFAGHIGASDVAERYDGYLETLVEHGICPDPTLFFEATDNLESGVAGLALDSAGRRS